MSHQILVAVNLLAHTSVPITFLNVLNNITLQPILNDYLTSKKIEFQVRNDIYYSDAVKALGDFIPILNGFLPAKAPIPRIKKRLFLLSKAQLYGGIHYKWSFKPNWMNQR